LVEEKPVIPKAFTVGMHHASCHFGLNLVFNTQCGKPNIDPQRDAAFIPIGNTLMFMDENLP